MKRWIPSLALMAVGATACGGDSDNAASTSTSAVVTTVAVPTSTTAAPATSTTRAGATTTTVAKPTAAKAVIEAAAVAGIPLGATKAQAIAVLGPPTATSQDTDLSGKKYDFLRWRVGSGERGLTLNFRTDSVTSPLLTDWTVNNPGPTTKGGVQVSDSADKVIAAHGALQQFCCDAKVGSVTEGGGRLIVIVPNGTKRVIQITGGDPAYWSRSIAD